MATLGNPVAMSEKIPRGPWTDQTAELIEKLFEKAYKALDIAIEMEGDVSSADGNADDPASSVGDVLGPAASVDGEVTLYEGSTGKRLKRADQTGLAYLTAGVLSAFAMATARILGRTTAGSGAPEELTLTEVLDLVGSAAEGDILYRAASDWARLPAADDGDILTLASGVPAWAAGASGTGFLSGSGHPQGTQSATVGNWYFDTATGYVYRKLRGSGNTGWYYVPILGAGAGFDGGPLVWNMLPGGPATTNMFSNVTTFGMLALDATAGVGASGVNSPARHYDSGKPYAQAQTGAVSGNVTSLTTPTGGTRLFLLDDDIDVTFLIKTGGSVADVRIWLGISNAGVSDTATLGSAGQGSIAFRFSTTEGDAGWRPATQINGGANQTLGAAIGSVAADTIYRLRIRFVRTGTPTAYFSVDDGAETAITTNIPATGNAFDIVLGIVTKAAAAKVIRWRAVGATIGS
jgi:hypothetical protein